MQEISGDLRVGSEDWEAWEKKKQKAEAKLYSFSNKSIPIPSDNLRLCDIIDPQERNRRLSTMSALDTREEAHGYLASNYKAMSKALKYVPDSDNKTVGDLDIENFERNFLKFERLNQKIAISKGTTITSQTPLNNLIEHVEETGQRQENLKQITGNQKKDFERSLLVSQREKLAYLREKRDILSLVRTKVS